MNYNKTPESRIRVRFKDCDPLGHLYNTRFLEYMLESREDHIIDHYGLNLEEYATVHGRAWIVSAHQISYLREAKRNEFIRIRSSMIDLGKDYIVNEYQMWDDDLTTLKSLMWTKFLHIDLSIKKLVPHDSEMCAKLENILISIEQNGFEERVKFLRNNGLK
ncbi:MAG: acyl-CoA thioesterase [Saprospiraceae bacterium]|nr:acyl-CoA thioesterase [Saprospiraceae bacterium]